MINYIKNIKLYNEKSGTTHTLYFEHGANIIIGPKGGGKSTLLNLIYSLYKKQRLSNDVIKALREFQLQPLSIEYADGQITNMNELSILDKSDEIVTQLDDNKTRLNENKEIALQREKFVQKLIIKNANEIIDIFKDYFNTFFDLYKMRLRQIQWNLFPKIQSAKENVSQKIINKLINDSSKFTDNIRKYKNSLDKIAKSIGYLNAYEYINKSNDNEMVKKFIGMFESIKKIHSTDAITDIINLSSSEGLNETIRNAKMEIQQKSTAEVKIANFKNDARSYFVEAGKQIAKNIAAFQTIIDEPITFKVNGEESTKYGMSLYINDSIEFNNDNSQISDIFSKSLNKAKKDSTKWFNWLYASFDSDQPTKINQNDSAKHILIALKKLLDEKVKLMVEGKDYQTMSTGTKTSFGIRQKVINNKSAFLFMDQPEDNLDNNTIYESLIPLIENKMGDDSQLFIVTHNANFGINLKTCSATIADLSNVYKNKNPYEQIFDLTEQKIIDETKKADSPIARYLEGGLEAIEKRYKKLTVKKGGKQW